MDLIEWRTQLGCWLERLTDGLEPGRFRFCLEGDRVPTSGRQAQFATCFAMKAAWQSGIWEEWPESRRRSCTDFLRSFQSQNGLFEDEWLKGAIHPSRKEKLARLCRKLLGRAQSPGLQERTLRNSRAETRQSAATLLMVGERPRYPLPVETGTPSEVRAYLNSFDWTDPWSAGSHLSHLVCFISANRELGTDRQHYVALLEEVGSFLNDLWNVRDGAWFRGTPSDLMKVNGAMKVLSGLHWLDQAYPDCRNLMDLALQRPFETDGCGFVNRLFVVHEALRGVPPKYRDQEIRDLALTALNMIEQFRRDDGGFSFHVHGAQTHYYGARVSDGRPVGDLHGAAMMTWGIALCLAILGEVGIPGTKMWRVHRA